MKRYADEADADAVRSIPLLVVSQLARVEVPAALWKKSRVGELSTSSASILIADFEADYFGTPEAPSRFIIVAPVNAVLDDATRLLGTHGLRAYDAVQLATAITSRAASGDLAFLAYDKALCSAAGAEGFELWEATAS